MAFSFGPSLPFEQSAVMQTLVASFVCALTALSFSFHRIFFYWLTMVSVITFPSCKL